MNTSSILRFRHLMFFSVVASGLLLFTPAATTPSHAASEDPRVVVSLTFDDGIDDIVAAEQVMHEAGLVGTFYITDQWVGQEGFVTREELRKIHARGNEIGGHTVSHPWLPAVSSAEQQRQICNNRATLETWGFRPVSFAYPFASADEVTHNAVQACGYHTARGLGSIKSDEGCPECDVAENLVSGSPMWLRAPAQVHAGTTLDQLQRQVTQAASTGGWVILTFHQVCANPGTRDCPAESSISPQLFAKFIAWLAKYTEDPANSTVVRTIDEHQQHQLGADYPEYEPAQRRPSPPGQLHDENVVKNPSFEVDNPLSGAAQCFQVGGWGTNTATFEAAPGYRGDVSQRIDITNYESGDAKVLPTLDLGECSPTVHPRASYDLGAWYRSTGTTQFALYYRTESGHWRYWTSSPWFSPANTWTQARWRTPPLPDDAVALSFGLALISNGTLWVDDYSMFYRLPSGSATARLRFP